MYLSENIDIGKFQIKKRKTTHEVPDKKIIFNHNSDLDELESKHTELEFAFKKSTTTKKRKNHEMDNFLVSSISKPSQNAKIFYSKYENMNTNIYKPYLL